MTHPTVARIDLDAVAANFRSVRDLVGPVSTIAVVKANAYGHGALAVGRALEAAGATMLACADIEEGVALREGGVRGPILVFGALGVSRLDGLFTHDLTPTISTPWAGRALEREATRHGARLRCHLKIDTGMNRLGLRADNLRRTVPELAAHRHLELTAVYTHFATADDPDDPFLDEQRRRFDRAVEELAAMGVRPPVRHAANSAALLRDERAWYDAVRPGLLLYGLAPAPLATTLPLRPALRLESRLVAVKGVRAGEGIGYGLTEQPGEPRTIGVVPAGYADGLDRRLAGRGHVLVGGRRVPIVGAVSMDMITVDVTGLAVGPGDEVVVLGTQGDQVIDAREMAAAIGTIPYEVLARIGTRIERTYDG